MAGYITYWSKDHIKDLQKAGDTGPLSVILGSHHTAMPSIAGVRVGDTIYPVTIQGGTLAVMARMRVEKIEPAFDYLLRETGSPMSALIPEDTAIEKKHVQRNSGEESSWFWMAGAEYVNSRKALPERITRVVTLEEQSDKPHKRHQEPHTCCAKLAASGRGSEIRPRLLPPERLPDLRFGPSRAKEKPLRLGKDGGPTVVSLSGFIRKMSEETQAVFEALFIVSAVEKDTKYPFQ